MNEKNRKKQKMLLGALMGSLVLIVIGFTYLSSKHKAPVAITTASSVDLPGDTINPQDIWMNRMEAENKVVSQKLKYLEDVILSHKKQEESHEKEKAALQQEIIQLKENLKQVAENPLITQQLPDDPFDLQSSSPSLPHRAILQEIAIPLPTNQISHVDKAIPAGTTVKAILVSSVDATCGVHANSDPIPIKLHIIDDAHLPKEVRVLLKGGILIGSSYGNISSERVYMRLEKLTQVNPEGNFVETDVAGYVSGEDGKYGVRGTVVDRSAQIIAHAAVSGAFAETSQILQSALSRYSIDNYMNNEAGVGYAGLQQKSFGGAGNAFDMLADYYINRAEQVMPVIQVNAGRVVDVTFTHGVTVGDIHIKEKIKADRQQARVQS